MEELKFCRICFSTDGKFYDMEKYNLVSLYQGITEVIVMESLPQLLCSFCHALLRKFIAFKQKCITAQNLLLYALVENKNQISKEILEDTRKAHNIGLAYTIIHCKELADDSLVTVKSEHEDYDSKLDLTIFYSDDDELKSDEEKLETREEKMREEKSVKEIKNESKESDDSFEESNTDFENNDESDDWGVEKSEEIDEYEFDACISKRTLTRQEQLQEIVDRKKSDNYLNSSFTCQKCFRGYATRKAYHNHMARHDDPVNGSFICDICHIRSKSKYTLAKHKCRFHYQLYTCKICLKTFKVRIDAKLHTNWHSGVKYKCQHCDLKFNALSTLHKHGRAKHLDSKKMDTPTLQGENETPPTTETTCATCKVNFHNKDALLVHIDTSIDKQCDPNTRSCVDCGSNFSSMDKLQNHQKIHHDASVKCSECDQICESGQAYIQHCRLKHGGYSNKVAKCKVHVCEVCGNTYTKNSALITHRRTHTGERPFACALCPKKFAKKERLRIHIKSHTEERSYKCKLCPKSYKTASALWIHNKVHTRDKPNVYSEYPKRFSAKVAECKDQVCEVCGNSYRTKNALITHQRIHTGERPFACSLCPKKFAIKERLQVHIRVHTGEKSHQCKLCPKSFGNASALWRHNKVHTGDKPHECSGCQKRFSQSNSLKLHIRTVHMKLPTPYKSKARKMKQAKLKRKLSSEDTDTDS